MSSRTGAKSPTRLTPGWVLRIELLDVTPTVWRRIVVPATIRLPALHRVFQTALGWTNSHLHEFIIGGQRYSTNDPDMIAELEQKDERRVVLEKALGHEARCFDYVYDFGDDWHHVVLLDERYAPPDPQAPLRCLEGENACPPEDVGGPHGYAEFLNAIADPRHAEHANWLAWVGGHFNPMQFDAAAVNAALSKIRI